MLKNYILIFLVLSLGFFEFLEAHPMDAARLQIDVQENRAIFNLKIHQMAVEKLLAMPVKPPKADEKNKELEESVFKATLGATTPVLNNEVCEWRRPKLSGLLEGDTAADKNSYLILEVVAVCGLAKLNTESIEMKLPFLNSMSSVFKMITLINGLSSEKSEAQNLILSPQLDKISINAEAYRSQNLFIKLGMAHIGVDRGEWISKTNSFQWPDGLDHILFVLALVLTSQGVLATIKNATGFTIGHTLTLILSTYKIIHVHSHWIEALIALSIAVVIAFSYYKKENKHGLFFNSILGTLHGLGFASVIQDLQMPQELVLPTLFSFNVGVEVGQIVIILVSSSLLYGIKKLNQKFYSYFTRGLIFTIFITSLIWFVQRGLG